MSFRLHCQFAILIMTMKTPADFRTLWTERCSRNDLNGFYGTKRFENETERFHNGTLLRCSSALQGIHHTSMKQNQIYKYANKIDLQSTCIMIVNASWNNLNIFLLFRYCLPLEKDVALNLNKLESPPTKVALCPVWWKLTQWFWRKRWKCEKFTDRQTDGQTDDRRSEKLTWAFSSGELQNTVLQDAYPFTAKNHAKGGETDSFCHKRYFFKFFKKVLNWFYKFSKTAVDGSSYCFKANICWWNKQELMLWHHIFKFNGSSHGGG